MSVFKLKVLGRNRTKVNEINFLWQLHPMPQNLITKRVDIAEKPTQFQDFKLYIPASGNIAE